MMVGDYYQVMRRAAPRSRFNGLALDAVHRQKDYIMQMRPWCAPLSDMRTRCASLPQHAHEHAHERRKHDRPDEPTCSRPSLRMYTSHSGMARLKRSESMCTTFSSGKMPHLLSQLMT